MGLIDEVNLLGIFIYYFFLSLPDSFLKSLVFKKKKKPKPAISASYWISKSQLFFLIEAISNRNN